MAAIILPHRWVQAPQFAVEVDWNNDLTRGMVELILPYQLRSLVNRVTPTRANSVIGFAHGGKALDTTGSTGARMTYEGEWSRINFPLTLVCVHTLYTGGSAARLCGNFAAGVSGYTLAASTMPRGIVADPANQIATSPSSYVFNRTTTEVYSCRAGSQDLYVNGVRAVGTTAASMVTPTGNFTIGADTGQANAFPTRQHMVGLWARALTAAEAHALSISPFQLLRPARRRIWSLPVTVTFNPAWARNANTIMGGL